LELKGGDPAEGETMRVPEEIQNMTKEELEQAWLEDATELRESVGISPEHFQSLSPDARAMVDEEAIEALSESEEQKAEAKAQKKDPEIGLEVQREFCRRHRQDYTPTEENGALLRDAYVTYWRKHFDTEPYWDIDVLETVYSILTASDSE
jgi:alanyl-tRNA synthetase